MQILAVGTAGGTPTADLIPATIVAALFVLGLAAFAWAHRSLRTRILTDVADFSERVSGLPAWAAVPGAVAGAALLTAVFGFYWDVATHIDNGRDPGPFANTAHYFIIAGLGGIFVAGYLALLIGDRTREDPLAVEFRGWRVPVGGVLLTICGAIAVLGFPLDDIWHRIFGQDVTLWGPTHVQMIGGAALSTLALWILMVEANRARPRPARSHPSRFAWLVGTEETWLAGSFLLGASAFQAEFDYSVPQFRLLYEPVLLVMAAAIALIPARIRLGRGGALKAVGIFIAIRGALSLIVGVGLNHTVPHFPLYVAEAIVVEVVALLVSTDKQLSFAAWAGAAIGTVGLAGEWAWSHLWMPIPWPASLMPQAAPLALAAGVSAGLLGGLIGRSLQPADVVRQRAPRAAIAGMVVGLLAASFVPLPITTDVHAAATVSLRPVPSTTGLWVDPTVRVRPASAIGSYDWFDVTAWQGGGSVVAPLRSEGGGVYRTQQPVPVTGQWKTLIRLHEGSSIVAVPIYMPADPAIPAPQIPAKLHFTRPFVRDKRLLLREARTTDPWVSYVAYSLLTAVILLWLVALGWGLRRLDGSRAHIERGAVRIGGATAVTSVGR